MVRVKKGLKDKPNRRSNPLDELRNETIIKRVNL
jgi:hypothetical protein